MENSKFKPDYFKVAYGIRTPSYYRPKDNELGFQSEAESMAFFADCERVFRIGGWKIEHGYAVNGKSSLYLHPQQFLGTVHTELFNIVPELIAWDDVIISKRPIFKQTDKMSTFLILVL